MINSGLGATIAEKFAAEGANVVINYVSSEDRAKETEAKINSQYAVKTAIVQGVCSFFFIKVWIPDRSLGSWNKSRLRQSCSDGR